MAESFGRELWIKRWWGDVSYKFCKKYVEGLIGSDYGFRVEVAYVRLYIEKPVLERIAGKLELIESEAESGRKERKW